MSKFGEFHFQHELFNQTDIRSPLAKKVKVATSTPKKVQFDNDLGQFEQFYKFESLTESKQNENDEAFKDQETNYVAVVQDAASSDKEIDNDMSVEINYMSLLDDNENDALLDAKSENDEVFKDQVTNYVADVRDAASSDEEINNDMSVELSSLSLLDNDENGALLDELSQLLPSVLQSLERSNQKETFMKFARMVASGHFPLHNIAYLLFMDIVEWFSSESTSQMRYSEDVKKFWRVGLILFKGKFLRFMSGMKNKGQLTDEHVNCRIYKPFESKVNFAVPNRNILDTMNRPIDALSPKILTDMIDMISESDPQQTESFKICVDGKKINSGTHGQKLGDINLWGFESSPTLEERESRFSKDISVLNELQERMVLFQIQELELLEECSDNQMEYVSSLLRQAIFILSNRLSDLRTGCVGQNLALQKLLKEVSGDWRTSKYGYAISAVKTKLHDMDTCIYDTLNSVDDLGKLCSVLSGTELHYNVSSRVQLDRQGNYVCLQGLQQINISECDNVLRLMPVIQQRSEAWFAVRKLALVTGSTFNKAIGMEGLKRQQSHFDAVYNNKEQQEPDLETKKRFQHGQVNEINAVATLVSKVLPIYFPELEFYEEGCYALKMKNDGLIIVSPDGSLRHLSKQEPSIGIEIKCPYPGKTFTTPVHYKLPTYYVPQVLCEMAVLKVDQLLFVSYSEQSTSVL